MIWGCSLISDSRVIAKNRDFVVVSVGTHDTLETLASAYLGDEAKAGVIADFNGIKRVKAGQEVVVPLRSLNRAGVFLRGYRTVPILTYHRFAPAGRRCGRLAVSADSFAKQLQYLKDNGYTVIGFPELAEFIEGKALLPPKSVILSIDDGYRSVYTIAYPLLRRFGFKATVFIYSEFVGAPAALTWPQMKEMVRSGLIDIQPHSKSHYDLTKRLNGESESDYLKRLTEQIRYPARQIKSKLGIPIHTFSYPYGAENNDVVEAVKSAGYRLGATVTRGGNPAFSHPYVLRRTQIYCNDDLNTFANRLMVFQKASLN